MLGRIGYDVEYAVKSGSHYVPAGVLPISGRKGSPEPLKFGGVEIDCCAVEITPPPANDEDSFVNNLMSLLSEVRSRYSQVELTTISSVHFPKVVLDNTPFANEMGCQPDYDAWHGVENFRPIAKRGLRTFGGHVHIEGGTVETIKSCDLVMGTWSVLVDKDTKRRALYGKAGAYRPKPYGVEYRVLSNFWCDSESLIREVYQRTRAAQNIQSNILEILPKIGGVISVLEAINDSNKSKAKAILHEVEKWI